MTTSNPNTLAQIARTLAVFAERIVELEESLSKAEADRDIYRMQWVFMSGELDKEWASQKAVHRANEYLVDRCAHAEACVRGLRADLDRSEKLREEEAHRLEEASTLLAEMKEELYQVTESRDECSMRLVEKSDELTEVKERWAYACQAAEVARKDRDKALKAADDAREERDRKLESLANSTVVLRHVNDERDRLLDQRAAALAKVAEMLQHRTRYAISDTTFQPLNELYQSLLPPARDVK